MVEFEDELRGFEGTPLVEYNHQDLIEDLIDSREDYDLSLDQN
jgi:hypothetical protein